AGPIAPVPAHAVLIADQLARQGQLGMAGDIVLQAETLAIPGRLTPAIFQIDADQFFQEAGGKVRWEELFDAARRTALPGLFEVVQELVKLLPALETFHEELLGTRRSASYPEGVAKG